MTPSTRRAAAHAAGPGVAELGADSGAGPGAAGLGEAPAARPLRADAARNRQRILAAAEEVFAREGITAPVEVVAATAGVGVGTVYRHFPTKEALFEAIVATRLDDLLAAAEGLDGADGTEALFAFLDRMADEAAAKHDLVDAMLAAGIDVKSACADRFELLEARVDRLRERAVAEGGMRPDVTTPEVIGLVIGVCQSAERAGMEPECCHRMVRVVCDGLRAT